MKNKFRIFGGSLATLVVVQKLAENKDNCVEWYLGPKINSIGGYFSGVKVFGQLLDIGMVALEVDEPTKQLEKFGADKPVRGKDINPYLHKVRSWLQNQGILISGFPIYTNYKNKLYPDLFITNDLELLKVLHEDKKTQEIYNENLYDYKLHPKNKYDNNFALGVSLSEYLDRIYGETELSKIIKEFVIKIGANALDKVLVSKHRSLWIPLYYPETIKRVIIEKILDNNIKRSFSCVDNNTLSNSINIIIDAVKMSKNVRLVIMNSVLDRASLINNLDSNQNNIFIDDQKLLSENIEIENEYLNVNIVFIKTFVEIPNLVVFDADPTTDFYRLTSRNTFHTLGFNYICLETKIDFQNQLNDPIFIERVERYISLNISEKIIVEDIHQKSGRLNLFTSQSVSNIETESEEISELLKVNKVTNLSFSGMTSSMNEQILLGLWYVELLEKRDRVNVS
jgi:hypothetical protein